MSRVKSAFIGSISSQFYIIGSMLITIFATPFIVKNLEKDEYGFSIILFQLISYLGMFDFGLGAAVSRFLAMNRAENEKEKVNQIISTSFFAFMCLAIFIIIIALGIAPFLTTLFEVSNNIREVIIPIFISTSFIIALQFPAKSFNGLLFAHQRQFISNTLNFFITITSLLTTVTFIYFGYGLWAFVISNVLTTFINIITNALIIKYFYPWIRIRFDLFDKNLLNEMYKYGIHIFIIGVAVQVVFNSDRFITGSIISLSAVAIYSLTMRVPEIAMNLVTQISGSVFPALVEISNKENIAKFKEAHQNLMIIAVSLIMISFWSVLSFNKHFIGLWVGTEFYAGDFVLLMFLILTIFLVIVNVSSSCLSASGYITKLSKFTLIEAGLNIVLSIWLGKLFGLKGIVMATIIATLVTSNTLAPIAIKRQLGISFREYFEKPIIYPIIGISIFGILLYGASQLIFRFLGLDWIILISTGAIVVLFLMVFTWYVFLRKNIYPYLPERIKSIQVFKFSI